MKGAWRPTGVDDLLSLRVVLLSVDVPAQKILPALDLGALAGGKVSPAHTVRADGTVEIRFPVFEPRGFPCGQLAGRDALGDTVLLILPAVGDLLRLGCLSSCLTKNGRAGVVAPAEIKLSTPFQPQGVYPRPISSWWS